MWGSLVHPGMRSLQKFTIYRWLSTEFPSRLVLAKAEEVHFIQGCHFEPCSEIVQLFTGESTSWWWTFLPSALTEAMTIILARPWGELIHILHSREKHLCGAVLCIQGMQLLQKCSKHPMYLWVYHFHVIFLYPVQRISLGVCQDGSESATAVFTSTSTQTGRGRMPGDSANIWVHVLLLWRTSPHWRGYRNS